MDTLHSATGATDATKPRKLDFNLADDTIIDLSAIHNIMYNAAESQGLNSQDVIADGVENWLKKVQDNPQMWFELVQRCSKSLLSYQTVIEDSLGLLTNNPKGDLVALIQDLQDQLTSGLRLLVANPDDLQEVAAGNLVELINELNDTLANRQGDVERLEDEAASNTQTEDSRFTKLTSDFDKLNKQYHVLTQSLVNCKEELKAEKEQGAVWQKAYYEHRTQLGQLAERTQNTVTGLNQTIADRDHEIERLNNENLVATTTMHEDESQTQPQAAPTNFDHLFNAPAVNARQGSSSMPPPSSKRRGRNNFPDDSSRNSSRNRSPDNLRRPIPNDNERNERISTPGASSRNATAGASSLRLGIKRSARWPDPDMFTGDDSTKYRK
jgi:myosin heavy subunit